MKFMKYFVPEMNDRIMGFAAQAIVGIFLYLMYRADLHLYQVLIHKTQATVIYAIGAAVCLFGFVEVWITTSISVRVPIPFTKITISIGLLSGAVLWIFGSWTILSTNIYMAIFSLNLWLIGLSAMDAIDQVYNGQSDEIVLD